MLLYVLASIGFGSLLATAAVVVAICYSTVIERWKSSAQNSSTTKGNPVRRSKVELAAFRFDDFGIFIVSGEHRYCVRFKEPLWEEACARVVYMHSQSWITLAEAIEAVRQIEVTFKPKVPKWVRKWSRV